ncbi:hypothetical protein LMG3458_05993 [Achromobacter deleyi]|uniref:DUF3304 domain-containing protein n=1 Tax=Achromobacter deleyi TaxID=1353891 RepID=A0A6S7APS9_9BURK|nr:hypothetical protein [Achromobacter deleyi]CAB3742721.1 hypothetical protein LMG3458_05993 [Achromobacter deleyi]CAB3922211.1 hypothetical protein LMG3481_05453 [Achromobacter deleyi]CAB3926720.1 hypothetical protein LMG3482_06006 [Achromobacter deleyi]
MRKGLILVLMWLGLLTGCNSEPNYQGVTFVVFNYTPWDLASVRITDADGRAASMGAIGVGGGEGSGSCCYTLKGTDFSVAWRGADGEEIRKHVYDGKLDEVFFNKTTALHFPATEVPSGKGPLYLQLHIYPDEHMELALGRKLLGQTRLPLVDTTDWLYEKYRSALSDYRSDSELLRVVGKVAKKAWMKYRIEDESDMKQYMYLYFTVASNFDANPDVAEILARPGRKPGDFARAIAGFSPEKIDQLRATGTPAGDKNG